MEFTKFALNFYFYCLINPDIRRVCIVLARCEKISRQPRIKGFFLFFSLEQYLRNEMNIY